MFVPGLLFSHLHVRRRVIGKIKQNELDYRDTAPLMKWLIKTKDWRKVNFRSKWIIESTSYLFSLSFTDISLSFLKLSFVGKKLWRSSFKVVKLPNTEVRIINYVSLMKTLTSHRATLRYWNFSDIVYLVLSVWAT